MLLSLGLMLLLGLVLGALCKKIHIPSLVGFIFTGIVLGPDVLNLLDSNLMAIASDLRTIALVIILIRAGLSLDIKKLLKQGRPALLLTFLPATFEIIGTVLFAHFILGWPIIDGFILGTILAAVSPAVIVPRMIHLIESRRGTYHSVPQMVMAGASADDIFVILLFTVGISLKQSGSFDWSIILWVPIEIILGAIYGFILGRLLVWLFKKYHMRDTIKVLIIVGLALILLALEHFHYSGLIAIIALALVLYQYYPILSSRLVKKYEKIWVFTEMLLFILVGAVLDLSRVPTFGLMGLGLIGFVLVFRLFGVWLSTTGAKANLKERLFMVFAYIPKATVQASIGAIPLSLGLDYGQEILAIAILAILMTAPIGAFLIDYSATRLLSVD